MTTSSPTKTVWKYNGKWWIQKSDGSMLIAQRHQGAHWAWIHRDAEGVEIATGVGKSLRSAQSLANSSYRRTRRNKKSKNTPISPRQDTDWQYDNIVGCWTKFKAPYLSATCYQTDDKVWLWHVWDGWANKEISFCPFESPCLSLADAQRQADVELSRLWLGDGLSTTKTKAA